MIFGQGRPTTHTFIFNNEILELVTTFKYLGIHLFKNTRIQNTKETCPCFICST